MSVLSYDKEMTRTAVKLSHAIACDFKSARAHVNRPLHQRQNANSHRCSTEVNARAHVRFVDNVQSQAQRNDNIGLTSAQTQRAQYSRLKEWSAQSSHPQCQIDPHRSRSFEPMTRGRNTTMSLTSTSRLRLHHSNNIE